MMNKNMGRSEKFNHLCLLGFKNKKFFVDFLNLKKNFIQKMIINFRFN